TLTRNLLPIQINHHHVARSHHALTHGSWGRQDAIFAEPHRKVPVRGRYVAALVDHPAEADNFFTVVPLAFHPRMYPSRKDPRGRMVQQAFLPEQWPIASRRDFFSGRIALRSASPEAQFRVAAGQRPIQLQANPNSIIQGVLVSDFNYDLPQELV